MSKETKDQQPSSEFTTKIKKRWLAEAPHTDSILDYAICAIIGLCDRLDTSEQQRKDLLDACKKAKTALNLCARVFLGTGKTPEPDVMADAIIEIDVAIAKDKTG